MSSFGIFTFYNEKNYGAALQACALQHVIQKMGYSAEFVRVYENSVQDKKYLGLKDYYRVLKNNQFSFNTYMFMRNIEHAKYAKFDEFVERYMKTSCQAFYSLDELVRGQQQYTGFICGSDMVWSDLGQNLDIYFLTFADSYKRIAYAPSITGREGESNNEREYYKKCINDMAFLSCREQYGVEYIKELTGKNAQLVLDPTLLLDKKQWMEFLNIKGDDTNKAYILCYMFGGISKRFEKSIFEIQQKYGLEVRYIPISNYETRKEIQNGYDGIYGPREFVQLFLNAELILTNSYHGLLFSIIMQKSFFLFHRGQKNEWFVHEERMNNILKLIHLEERYIYEEQLEENLITNIEYSEINKVIEKERKKSLLYLKNALDMVDKKERTINADISKLHSIEELEKNKCTGCSACVNSCPLKCITLQNNIEGFREPIIERSMCIECHKCVDVCPAVSYETFNYPQETFCGYGINENIKKSASGGVFVTIAKWIIRYKYGIVFGAAMDYETNSCHHIMVDKEEELCYLQNSKYIQSDISDALKECLKHLKGGKYVLFSGTPCQIAALNKFLGKSYETLFTIDIICHGVPSPKFFNLYMKNEIKGKVDSYMFRHKLDIEHKRSAFESVVVKDGKKKIIPGGQDTYYKAFLDGSSYREACYTCKYAREERVGDITIGDCDSWRRYSVFTSTEVISTILVNTEQGKRLWDMVSEDFKYTEMDYTEECIANHQLRHPTVRPGIRNRIYLDIEKLTWNQFRRKYGNYGIISVLKKLIIHFIR